MEAAVGRRRPALVAGLTFALLVVAQACSSSDDEKSAAANDAGSDTADQPFGDSECGACVKDTCTAPYVACEADPSCAAYLTCLFGCPVGASGSVDATCEQGCPEVVGSTGILALDTLATCRASAEIACDGCGASLGDAGAEGGHPILNQVCPPSEQTNPCWACEDTYCCDTHADCKNDPECDAFTQCVLSCPEPTYEACMELCDADHPDGFAGFSTRLACVNLFCNDPAQCGGGTLSPCVACVYENCAEPFVNCQSDASCARLDLCVSKCDLAVSCMHECNNQYPDGVTLYEAYGVCATQRCSAECSQS